MLLCRPAWAAQEIFILRAAAHDYDRQLALIPAAEGGTPTTLGTFTFVPNWIDGIQTFERYAELSNVSLEAEPAEFPLTFTTPAGVATVDAAAMATALGEGNHVLWLDFVPAGSPPAQTFIVQQGIADHALALIQPGDRGQPVSVTALSAGEDMGFLYIDLLNYARRASAPVDITRPFWVADLTTGLRAPTGATFIGLAMAQDTESYALESVTIFLNPIEQGGTFTLHYQLPGQDAMVQSLTAALTTAQEAQQMGDWSWLWADGYMSVTGNVAVGASYWLTRDSDGWDSSVPTYAGDDARHKWQLVPFAPHPTPLAWSLLDMPPPPIPWEARTFEIAAGMGGNAHILQPSGTRFLTQIPPSEVFTIEDYDMWGNAHSYSYEKWTADIDPREDFWLVVGGTQQTQGEISFTNGWSAQNGTPPNWQPIQFGIASGMGSAAVLTQSNGSPALTLAGSNFEWTDYNSDGSPNFFYYDLWNATVDVTRPFTLSGTGWQLGTNETWFFNGWMSQGGAPQNWQTLNFFLPSSYALNPSDSVRQGNNWISLTDTGLNDFIEDYWQDGTENFLYLKVYSAQVDVNRPWHLSIYYSDLPDGQATYYGNWARQYGAKVDRFTLSVALNGDRVTHDFTITEPNGTSWPWTPSGEWTNPPPTLQFTDIWTQLPWILAYNVLNTSWTTAYSGMAGPWILKDVTTGEENQFYPGDAHAYWLDASQWWLPPQNFALTVSLSRWSHDLRIVQRAAPEWGDYFVTKIASQGGVTMTNEGAWYEPYYYFDATSQRRHIPGMDWWLYDATLGEYAPMNTADLATWHYTPTPVGYDAGAWQSNVTAVEARWCLLSAGAEMLGGGFLIERSADSGTSWMQISGGNAGASESAQAFFTATSPNGDALIFHLAETGLAPGGYVYRITYHYGEQWSASLQMPVFVRSAEALAELDSDHDTYTDLEEMLARTSPYNGEEKPAPPPSPTDLAALQTGLNSFDLRWNHPAGAANPATGNFAVEYLFGGQWVEMISNTVDSFRLVPAPEGGPAFHLPISEAQLGNAYGYRIIYSLDGHPSLPAYYDFSLLDAAGLAGLDSDGDGANDLWEIVSGTDPFDPAHPDNRPAALTINVPQDAVKAKAGYSKTFTVSIAGSFDNTRRSRTLAIAQNGGPTMGEITLAADGDTVDFSYTGNPAASGADSVTIVATETFIENGQSVVLTTNTATVPIQVLPALQAQGNYTMYVAEGSGSLTLEASGGTTPITFEITGAPDSNVITLGQAGAVATDETGTPSLSTCAIPIASTGPAGSGPTPVEFTFTDADGDSSTATVDIVIVQFQEPPVPPPPAFSFAEFLPNSGFDSSTQPPWLMVPQGGLNWAKAFTPASNTEAVNFAIQPLPSEETVSPATTNISPETVTVTGSHLGDNSQVTATTASNPTITGNLKISVKPYKHYNVVFHKVTQDSPGAQPPAFPDRQVLETFLNKVFGLQANIWFTVTRGGDLTLDYDKGGDPFAIPTSPPNGKLDAITGRDNDATTEEEEALMANGTPNAINVFYVWGMVVYRFNPITERYDHQDATGNTRQGRAIYVEHFPAAELETQLQTTAHEIGHELGLTHYLLIKDSPADIDNLMFQFKTDRPNAWRLIKEQWDIINPFPLP